MDRHRREFRCGAMLGFRKLRHEAEPFRHRTPGRQCLEPDCGRGKSRRGVGQNQSFGRLDPAVGTPDPLALGGDLALSHEQILIWASRGGRRWRRGPDEPRGCQRAEPFAVMPPRPAGRHIALRHRPHRAADPDRGVNVNDPDDDRRDRSEAMNQHGVSAALSIEV